MTIGERIKKLRKELDLTQQEFSNRLGVSRNNIATYETREAGVGNAVIKLICREFSVSEEWLRTGEGEMFDPTSEESIDELVRQHGFCDLERQILIDFVKLDPRDRIIALNYIKYLTANARLRSQKADRTIEEEADAFAAKAREQFLAEKKQALQALSARESDVG